jgi:hypothetical protein
MTADLNCFGVFVNGGLTAALFALLLQLPLKRLLAETKAYRYVWHPPLFDTAIFVVLWGAIAFLQSAFPAFVTLLLG